MNNAMNHVMYADDICLLAPSAIGLQRMLDVCFNFSIKHGIMFNLTKFVCVAFKAKNNKLYCPSDNLDCDILEYIAQIIIFIIVLLTLNWNDSEIFVPHFTLVMYRLHTQMYV